MSKWMPIETAPKEGTWVLVIARNAWCPIICHWRYGAWFDVEVETGHPPIDFFEPPTHWMPLPEPPEVER